MSDKNLPSRRVVIRLTAREKLDSASIFPAIRDAFAERGIGITVRTTAESDPILIEPEVIKDEPLETRGREMAKAVLDRENAKIRAETLEYTKKAEWSVAEIVAQRKGAISYLGFLTMKTVRITVEAYEKSAGAAATMITKTFQFFGGSDSHKD